MANRIDPKCKQCRRAGEKLFLKGERCFSPKCAVAKRPYAPGAKGSGKNTRRGGLSEFGRQLMQKQKVKKIYGVFEKQLKKYFKEAQAQKGDARENLIRKFEMRLDNVMFRLGWAKSRAAARQLVNHGHVAINGKRVSIPSYQVRKGESISLTEKTMKSKLTENLLASLKKYEAPTWLAQEQNKLEAKVLAAPTADELGDVSSIGLIVEYYSR
ncbi:MAG: 30S ribosomal protein S4 [Candidatus Portnoybacteria bacterium]|nr:30S ribosomal protein S4 [Candidatus Portnoybacteria bacterium]MDD4982426.1 30S ribosomal protein S4 [Candidatus Portnoybacteria bacterium]